jgi:hypothetical protein
MEEAGAGVKRHTTEHRQKTITQKPGLLGEDGLAMKTRGDGVDFVTAQPNPGERLRHGNSAQTNAWSPWTTSTGGERGNPLEGAGATGVHAEALVTGSIDAGANRKAATIDSQGDGLVRSRSW